LKGKPLKCQRFQKFNLDRAPKVQLVCTEAPKYLYHPVMAKACRTGFWGTTAKLEELFFMAE